MSVADTFHTFMLRKTLLTHWSVAFAFFSVNATVRHRIIRDTAATTLYIDLVSILDNAIELRMLPEDYEQGRKMKNRLEMLAKKDDLLDLDVLKAINDRRNEIGHEFDKGATVEELDEALEAVGQQVASWGMIERVGNYELKFTRTAVRAAQGDKGKFEQDCIIQIVVDGDTRLELKQTQTFG